MQINKHYYNIYFYPYDVTIVINTTSRAVYGVSNYSDLGRATSHLERNVVLIKGVVERTLLGRTNQPIPKVVARIRTSTIDLRRKEENGA